jgi:hypothetical protein
VSVPTVPLSTAQAVKMRLDAAMQSAMQAGDTNRAEAIMRVLEPFRSEMRAAVPAYAQAMDASSRLARTIDATDMARMVGRTNRPDFVPTMTALAQDQRAIAARGAAEGLLSDIGSIRRETPGQMERLLGPRAARERLASIVGPERAGQFSDVLQLAAQDAAAATASSPLSGSSTTPNNQMNNLLDTAFSNMPIDQAAMPVQGVVENVRRVLTGSGMSGQEAALLSDLLTDPQRFDEYIGMIEAAAGAEAAQNVRRNAMAILGAATGIAAQTPEQFGPTQ